MRQQDDDFKSHSTAEVKDFCQSLPFLSVDILPGGLTPCGQPLDKVINNVFKGCFRDLYDAYILSAPLTEKGNPVAPSSHDSNWQHGLLRPVIRSLKKWLESPGLHAGTHRKRSFLFPIEDRLCFGQKMPYVHGEAVLWPRGT